MLTIKPVNAQSLPTPSVPEFTVRLVNNSYSTQPTTTTTTDPYTGKQSTATTPSQYVKDEYIEVKITNQAFTPYTTNIQNVDTRVDFYFKVRSKGNYTDNWDGDGMQEEMNFSSQFTEIKLYTNNVPSPAKIDFEVQATIGFLINVPDLVPVPASYKGPLYNTEFNGTTSNWSPTQTITIGASSNSPTPIPTPVAIGSQALKLTISVIAVVIVLVIVLLFYRKHRKTANVT